jgi:hypothetical protein
MQARPLAAWPRAAPPNASKQKWRRVRRPSASDFVSLIHPELQIDVVLLSEESVDFAWGLKMQRSFASLRMTVARVEISKLYIAAGMSDLRLRLPKDVGKILALRRG